jgi:Transposase DDE domain
MLDPTLLPLHEIARLYARRWDIELAFKLLKRDLKLHLLWSAKPTVLAQQVWATLIIAQVLLALWVEIAGRAEVDVFEVSLALLVEYAPQLAADGQDPIAVFVERGRFARFIRPSRRTRNQAPVIPPEDIIPAPLNLSTSRPARYGTGQGSIPITPASAINFSPPPRMPIDPGRRGRGTGGRS